MRRSFLGAIEFSVQCIIKATENRLSFGGLGIMLYEPWPMKLEPRPDGGYPISLPEAQLWLTLTLNKMKTTEARGLQFGILDEWRMGD